MEGVIPLKVVKKNIMTLLLSVVFFVLVATGCNINNSKISVNSRPVLEQQSNSNQNPENINNTTQNETTKAASTNNSVDSSSQSDTTDSSNDNPAAILSGLEIHFIDVGQADSIYIDADGESMLIDAGNNGDADTVVNYIKDQDKLKLTYLFATHPHEDHIGGMDAVVKSFEIGSIYMPKATTTTKTYEDVLNAIKAKGLKIKTPTPGTSFKIGNATCTILAPNGSGYKDLNNYSIVLKIQYGDTSFLLTGDAEDVSENEMLNKGYDVKADVLKLGHHGSSSSTSSKFLDKVSPKYAVISVGKDNDYGHPTKETMDKLKSKGIPVYRTDENGTIILKSDGKTLTFSTKPGMYSYASSGSKQSSNNSTTTKINTSANTTTVKPTTPVTGNTNNKSITVYITNTGTKYHIDGCRYLKDSKISTSLNDAKSKGYTPCKVCNPPQ